MSEPVLTYELKSLLNYIKKELVQEFPIQVITLNYLIYAILDKHTNPVSEWLNNSMLSSAISDLRTIASNKITSDSAASIMINETAVKFAKEYDDIAEEISDGGVIIVSSESMFVKIIEKDRDYIRFMANNGFTIDMVKNVLGVSSVQQVSKDSEKNKKKKKIEDGNNINTSRVIPVENNIIEATCTNMVREASDGLYPKLVGYDSTVDNIFNVLGKCVRNTVVLVGDRGVGKTSVTQRIAQRLYQQECPKPLINKMLVRFDDQISSAIISEMNKSGKYIALVEDIERLFLNKETEQQNTYILKSIMDAPNVCTIFTANDAAYAKYIEAKPEFSRFMQKLKIEERSDEDVFYSVREGSTEYEEYNNVSFDDNVVRTSIKLARRFISNEKNPQAALDLLDTAGSYVRMNANESDDVKAVREQLESVLLQKKSIGPTTTQEDYEKKDALTREEIELSKTLKALEESHIETDVIPVTISDLKAAVSNVTNVPISDMDDDDRTKLRNLKSNLSKYVIGQDSTIDEVCRAVRRQRVGLSNPDKPCVMMFVGTTGTGKSYLAKRLAYEMYGDEKKMTRLDMSEYSEKTSVTKLYGTAPGYIGYEEGGVLTEAIKKNNRCVLLLDEIEKAHEDVFNVFLQVFDEGRLTDNKGNTIDFKNVIIIMTSNIGAKNISEKVCRIGYTKPDNDEDDKDIIKASIKKAFKPEFINRIDNICYFNKLTDDDLKNIIINEIRKVNKRIVELGYSLSDDILTGNGVERVFEKVKEESEYGARPIIREIQRQIEDKVTDYLIDNDVNDGFVFDYDTIYNKN